MTDYDLTKTSYLGVPLEEFTERLSRLAELSDEEIASLEEELIVAFDAADEAADLDGMQSMADAIESVRAERESRVPAEEVAADPAATAVEEVPLEMAASAAEEEPESTEPTSEDGSGTAEEAGDSEVSQESPESTEAEAPVAPEETPETAPEAVEEAPAEEEAETSEDATEGETPEEAPAEAEETPEDAVETPEASETSEEGNDPSSESEEQVAEITADDVPETNQPVAASVPTFTIRAGGDIPGVTAGSTLNGMDDVVDAMTRKVNNMRGVGGDGEHIVVASFFHEEQAADERTLRPGDMNGNAKKIRDFLSEPEALTREALTAAAWCAPRTPIYDVPTMGTTARPVRDALPSFNAERGGITWIAPPGLPAVDGAVSLWRHDGDDWASYSDVEGSVATNPVATKPCITIPCGPEKNADVDAIPVCFCFDNLAARAFPEWIRANTELVLIGQARFAEQVLLSRMYAVAATGAVCDGPATNVGAARDFILTVQTAAAAKRWNLRIAENAPLQLLAPAWVRTAIAVDLGLQAPGDNTFTTSPNEVDGYFREFGVDPIWHVDDVPGSAVFSGCAFPGTADWMLFPTGSFLRLDTGELNLGVVRTKEDVQKNKYCEFTETFETVAYVGPDSPNGWVTKGQTVIDLLGSYGAATDLSA